jgi:hypothetical protein
MFGGIDVSNPTRTFTPAEWDQIGPSGRAYVTQERERSMNSGRSYYSSRGQGGRGRQDGGRGRRSRLWLSKTILRPHMMVITAQLHPGVDEAE